MSFLGLCECVCGHLLVERLQVEVIVKQRLRRFSVLERCCTRVHARIVEPCIHPSVGLVSDSPKGLKARHEQITRPARTVHSAQCLLKGSITK